MVRACLLVWLISWNLSAFSQSSPLDNQIQLAGGSMRLGKVLKQIEQQSGVRFSYSRKIVPVQQKVTVPAKKMSVRALLQEILAPAGIAFVEVEKQVVLRRENKQEATTGTSPTTPQKKANYTLSGYLKDAASGEVLIGATIYVEELHSGTVANAYGFYSLTLPAGSYHVTYSFIGYGVQQKQIDLPQNTRFSMGLAEDTALLKEIVIDAGKSVPFIENVQKGQTELRPASVALMPSLMGEQDVIKSLQAVPGIKLFADGSTMFHVRGGDRDQNLILLDEAPIYNPSHVLGLFSTIVPDAVKDIKIYKGDLPVQQGGRLSSLIDIHTKEGNLKRFGMSGSLGLAASRLSVEGPFKKDKSAYFISGRFSNLNWFTKNIAKSDARTGFYDFSSKFNVSMGHKNRLFFSFYSGLDRFENRDNSGIEWGNFAATLRWNHIFNDRLFSNTSLYSSWYNYYLITSAKNNNRWHSSIANLSLKSDFSYFINPENNFYFGGKISFHSFNPGNFETGSGIRPADVPEVSHKNATELVLYAGNEQQFLDKISIKYGLRLSLWQNVGPATEYIYDENYQPVDSKNFTQGQIYNSYATLAPRFGLAYQFSPQLSAKAFYTRSVQNVHLITNSISPFTNFEVWMPSSLNIKPQLADQVGTGLFAKWPNKDISLSVEGYYKWMANQIDYKDHASMILNPFIEGELRTGKGHSYGAEIQLEKKQGRLTGWVGYAYSRAFRTIPEINNGEAYTTYFDRPHQVSVNLSQKMGRRWDLNASWIYASGASITTPSGFYWFENQQVPIYNRRGNDRLPDYHRLDLSVNYQLNQPGRRFHHYLNFSIYNLYGRHNAVYLNFNKTASDGGDPVVPGDLYPPPGQVPTLTYLYHVIPSVSYNFKL